jgi:hypothetical protein
MRVGVRPTGAPVKPFKRDGFEHRASRALSVEIGADAQQSGNRSQCDEQAQRNSRFEHNHSPLLAIDIGDLSIPHDPQ